jgi:hypothetical protein
VERWAAYLSRCLQIPGGVLRVSRPSPRSAGTTTPCALPRSRPCFSLPACRRARLQAYPSISSTSRIALTQHWHLVSSAKPPMNPEGNEPREVESAPHADPHAAPRRHLLPRRTHTVSPSESACTRPQPGAASKAATPSTRAADTNPRLAHKQTGPGAWSCAPRLLRQLVAVTVPVRARRSRWKRVAYRDAGHRRSTIS